MDNAFPVGRLAQAILLVFLVTGCAYQGSGIDNPVTRRAAWYSFVAGDDIRASCGVAGGDRYRLVYNGFWHDQVRIYELGLAQPTQLDQRVLEPPDLGRIQVDDLLAPWRGRSATSLLDQASYDRLVGSFAASDMFGPPPVGLRLPSDGFYWTAVGCRAGSYFHNAWLYPSERFGKLTFPAVLQAFDHTGVAINKPDPFAYVGRYNQDQIEAERWSIEVEPGSFSGPK